MLDAKQIDAMETKDRFQTLEGVSYYACVHRPNYSSAKLYGSTPTFEVKLGLDIETEIQKARDLGLLIKDPTDSIPHPHVEIKRKVKNEEDPEASKPSVVDSIQNEVPEEILIGNGSRLLCKFFIYPHPKMKEFGTGKSLTKVQILSLVPYEARNGDEQLRKDPEGFTIDANTAQVPDNVEMDDGFDEEESVLPDPFENVT